ncbi:MAG: AAA family ATPase, partial [Chloroflexota bacterium]
GSGRVYRIAGNQIPDDVLKSLFRKFYTYVPPIRDITEHLSLEAGEQYRAAIEDMLSRVSTHRQQTARRNADTGLRSLNRLLLRELTELTSTIKQFAPTIEPRFHISPDLIEVLRLIRLQLADRSHPESAAIDHRGQGLHSLVVLALHAHALERRLNGGIIAIEEPELHLHPNLQRHYVVLMRRLSQKKRIQIICTTHSPFLVNQIDLRRTAKIFKHRGQTTAVQPSPSYLSNEFKTFEKNLTSLWGEMLLAKGVVLVEGPSEHHALPVWASKIWVSRQGKSTTCTLASHSLVTYAVGSVTNFSNFVLFLRQFRTKVFILSDLDGLTRSRLLNQLRRGGIITEFEMRRYSAALGRGETSRVITWLRRNNVFIANKDFEDMVIDANTEAEVGRIVREQAEADFNQYRAQTINPRQVLADLKNQTANRIRQFREKIGVSGALPGELNTVATINAEYDRLYAEAVAAGIPAAGVVHSNLELLRKFIKKDKVLWHTRIVRNVRSGAEPQAIASMLREIILATMK